MNTNKSFWLVMIIIIICMLNTGLLYAQSGQIGDIKVTLDVDGGVKFQVYNLKVTGMKGKQIHFGFNISQNGKWLPDMWVGLEAQVVGYSPAYWNNEAFWFAYSYEELIKAGNAGQPFTGAFFIVSTATTGTIAQKEVTFSIPNTNAPEDTAEVNAGEKSWLEFFKEATKRLVKHPSDGNFKMDPQLFGEWKSIEAKTDDYSVLIKYLRLNKDASGLLEIAPLYLSTKKQFIEKPEEDISLEFVWGIYSFASEGGEPITMLKLYFPDESALWLYYAKFENNKFSVLLYDEASQSVGTPICYTAAKDFNADWNANSGKLLNSLWNCYQNDQQYSQEAANMALMGQDFAFQNLMAASGAWWAGVQPAVY